jgi:hypothetical protein
MDVVPYMPVINRMIHLAMLTEHMKLFWRSSNGRKLSDVCYQAQTRALADLCYKIYFRNVYIYYLYTFAKYMYHTQNWNVPFQSCFMGGYGKARNWFIDLKVLE